MLCAMLSLFHHVVWLCCVSLSSSTDLAAVYKHDILILRGADSILPNSLSWESLSLDLPRPLSYPVGLTQDTETNRLFVAEAKPKEDAKILSISLNSDFEVDDMTIAVKSKSMSVIEGMSYNPRSKHLYWVDASQNYIYQAAIPSEHGSDASIPELIQDLGRTTAPRGLTFDPCNEHLYWSERGTSGMVPSSVEMWDPDDNKHHIVQQDERKNDFYQGLAFDDTSGNLVWAATHGDDLNSTCRIVSTSVDDMKHEELVKLENCYPFSLTVDEKYTYWADWSRQGIMRASRSDPSDVVKLLHTPHVTAKGEQYFGVYGLAKVNTGKVDQTSCKGKKEKSQDHKDQLQNPAETVQERRKGTAKVKESTKLKKVNHGQNTEAYDESKAANPSATEHSEKEKDIKVYEDRIVENLRDMAMRFQASSSSVEPKPEAKLESVDTVTRVYNGKTQTGMSASQSTYEVPITECVSRYNEGHLMTTIVILAVICVIFLFSTIILAVSHWRRSCKRTSATAMEAPQAVIVQAPRQVKRFGPKKSLFSGNKSGLSGSSTCSGLTNNDGVTINIEDCCQMTLCETPCYTSVKKQGKSYKDVRKNCKTKEDKKGLLDDSEEI